MRSYVQSILLLLITILFHFYSFGSIYEAEIAVLYKAISETKNSGYLGDAYVNFDNEPGSFNSEKDTLKFVIDSDKNIQANFVETEFTLPEPDFSLIKKRAATFKRQPFKINTFT